MISPRHWTERRSFWHALVFWGWLASFLFSFAASDLLHAVNCPEQLALRSVGQLARSAAPQLTVPHALSVDVECASCLLQLSAQSVLALVAPLLVPFAVVSIAAHPRPLRATTRLFTPGARGPPALI